jgi:concanavalin A-like lectin/glucanase superfamily protein
MPPVGSAACGFAPRTASGDDDANNTLSIYADGVLITSGAATAVPTGSTNGLTLGGNNPANGGSPLDGMLDQVRLFGVGRSAQQICGDAGKRDC